MLSQRSAKPGAADQAAGRVVAFMIRVQASLDRRLVGLAGLVQHGADLVRPTALEGDVRKGRRQSGEQVLGAPGAGTHHPERAEECAVLLARSPRARSASGGDISRCADRPSRASAMRSRCGSISRFIRPRSSSATARRAPWRSSAPHSNPSACMAFIIRNAAGRLLVVAVCGIGVLHLADLNHSAEYPLPLLTQTLVFHRLGRAP
jgi:hypothetical protein